MPFLKNLLGQSDPQSSKSSSAILAQQFDKDWFNAVKRFGIVAGFGAFRFDVRDPNTREIINPHEGLAGTFDDWQQIKSPWDRQRHLFELLLDTMNKSMKLWQIANVLTAIRLPNRAVALLQENALPTPDSDDYTQVCSAFSKGFIGLQDGENALIWAQKAAEAKPDNAHLQVVLADALRLTGDCDKSGAIYSSLMGANPPSSANPANATKEMFETMFSRETGVVPSPIFAIEIAERMSNPIQAEEFWTLSEIEFYDSPYFRMHHAYHLASIGQVQRCWAKLVALVQEMPWLHEASINLSELFKKLDPNGTEIMPEFQEQLRQIITTNNWTADGMTEYKLES